MFFWYIWVHKGGNLKKLSYGSKTSDMTSEGLGEMFEGDHTILGMITIGPSEVSALR